MHRIPGEILKRLPRRIPGGISVRIYGGVLGGIAGRTTTGIVWEIQVKFLEEEHEKLMREPLDKISRIKIPGGITGELQKKSKEKSQKVLG